MTCFTMCVVLCHLLLAALPAVVAGAPEAPRAAVRVVQADSGPADAVVARIAARERARARVRAELRALVKLYESQLGEVDRLKKRRSSWRRDSLIRQQLREAQQTARKLRQASDRLRALRDSTRRERRALVVAINSELRGTLSSGRRQKLLRWRAAAQRSLRGASRKIVLPSSEIDPLADPEDLEAQARRIRQAEKRLAEEVTKLASRATRYNRMVALRRKRDRASDLGRMDDNRPRRTTGHGGSGSRGSVGLSSNDGAGAPDQSPAAGETDSGFMDMGDEGNSAVVLADVVDSSTIDALRRAESSNNPAAKAKAAERARKQVQARLERLKKRRDLIERRAKRLRQRRR